VQDRAGQDGAAQGDQAGGDIPSIITEISSCRLGTLSLQYLDINEITRLGKKFD
jgi:hypothetical protein